MKSSIQLTATAIDRFWGKVSRGMSCWFWHGTLFPNGYGEFKFRGSRYLAHRVAWQLVNGSSGNLFVLHHCDRRNCVRPDHLFLGTQQDNVDDMIAKGRRAPRSAHASPGVRNGRAELQAVEVAMLRALYRQGVMTQRGLAEQFQVSLALVQKILGGRVWKYPEAGYDGPIKTSVRGKWHRKSV